MALRAIVLKVKVEGGEAKKSFDDLTESVEDLGEVADDSADGLREVFVTVRDEEGRLTRRRGFSTYFDQANEAALSSRRVMQDSFSTLHREQLKYIAQSRDTYRHIDFDAVRAMRHIEAEAVLAARNSNRSFSRYLSADFFRDLAGRGASAFKGGISTIASGVSGIVGGVAGIAGGALSVLGGNVLTSILGSIKDKITGGVKTGFDFNKTKEQALLGFDIKLNGKDKALEFFNQITDFAEKAPMELSQTLESVQRLMVAFTDKEALYALDAITDGVSAQGKVGAEAAEQINGIGLQLQQMLLKNKVLAEDTSNLAERQVKVYKYLGDAISQTDKQFAALTDTEKISRVQEMAQKGMLEARTAVAVILRGMKEEYGGTAERIARETLAGIESNTNDRFSRLAGEASENAFARYKEVRQQFLDSLNSDVGDKTAREINSLTGDLLKAADTALGAIRSGNIGELGLDLGKKIVSGAVDGLKEGGQAVVDGTVGVFRRGYEAAKDFLQIKSPSLLYAELGFNAALGFHAGFQQGMEGKKEIKVPTINTSELEELKRAAADPNVRAFFEAIKKAEGGAVNRIVGGGTFKDLSRHPNIVGMVTPKGPSTAAGDFQITATNWYGPGTVAGKREGSGGLRDRLGLSDFGAESQMLAGIKLLNDAGGLSLLMAGKVEEAAKVAASLWQALPNSPLGGKYHVTMESFMRSFRDAGGAAADFPALTGYTATAKDPVYRDTSPYFTKPQRGDKPTEFYQLWEQPNGSWKADDELKGYQAMAAQRDALARRRADEFKAEESFVKFLLERYGNEAYTFTQAQVDSLRQQFAQIQQQLSERRGESDIGKSFRANFREGYLEGFDKSDYFKPEQSKQVLEAVNRLRTAEREVSTDASQLATTIIPRALKSTELVAVTSAKAFENLPPLIKASTDEAEEMQERMKDFAQNISRDFGGAFEQVLRGNVRGALKDLREDLKSTLIGMARDWFQSEIFKVLNPKQGMGGVSVGGSATGGSGGIIGSLVSGVKSLFGFGRSDATSALTGGFAGGNPAADVLKKAGAGLTPPASLTEKAEQQAAVNASRALPDITAKFDDRYIGINGVGAKAATSAATAGKLGFFGQLAAAAPMLGMSLGASLGGQSVGGQMLGGAGGLLAGGTLAAMLAPTALTGFGLSAGLVSGIAAAAPFLLPIAGAALVGAYFLKRNKERRMDETTRNTGMLDSLGQLEEVLRAVKNDRLDGSQAIQQANQIRVQYMQMADGLKDGKTRRIASADVTRLDSYIVQIRTEADAQLERQRVDRLYVPEFASGGIVGNLTPSEMKQALSMTRFNDGAMPLIKVMPGERFIPPVEQKRLLQSGGIIPGIDRGVDDTFMRAPVGSIILNKEQQRGLDDRRIQSFSTGGMVSSFNAYGGSLAASAAQFNAYAPQRVREMQSFVGMAMLSAEQRSAATINAALVEPVYVPKLRSQKRGSEDEPDGESGSYRISHPKVGLTMPSFSGIGQLAPAPKKEAPIVVNLTLNVDASLGVDEKTAGKIMVKGAETSDGREVVLNIVNDGILDRKVVSAPR